MKFKYFKENQKFFDWLNKNKEKINIIYVKTKNHYIQVKYEVISQN